jgi:hypothetical protein
MGSTSGALLSLPILLVATWYGWSAFAQIDRYAGGTADEVPWSLELCHIGLHDELVRDLRRLLLDEAPTHDPLPTFALSLTRASLDQLNKQLYTDAGREYVDGYVQKDGVIHEIRLRYRGSKPWHWIGLQKSMKLRLQRGDLIDGTRVFNLLNDPTPFGLEEQIILDLARELDLLTPEYEPVRVRLNNHDLGVFRYAAQPVEGLLRRGRRIPGHVYSGDSESVLEGTAVGDLFFRRDGWQQVAAAEGETPAEFQPLDRLLVAVHSASHDEFARFVASSLDLQRYATFDALDVLFAGNEHDYQSNHKFYHDPARGRLEPIAWSFRGFQYEPEVNLIDHPLLIRLKMTPGYLRLRNRLVFSLLMDQASVPSIRARAHGLFARMAGDLRTDPYWDAYKLLPRVTRFHRFMIRPMSLAKWSLASRAELHGYSRRVRFLLDRLEQPAIQVHALSGAQPGVDISVDGHASYRLREVTVDAACTGRFGWHADVDRDGLLGPHDPLIASGELGRDAQVDAFADLDPGVALVPRPDARPTRGVVRAQPEVRTYRYLLASPCAPVTISLSLANEVTGAHLRLSAAAGHAPEAPELPAISETPRFAVGDRSPHLWDRPAPRAATIVALGPGDVDIAETRIFASHQRVVVAPGTHLHMAPGASLVFRGPVGAHGTRKEPIRISRSVPSAAFGGIVLQGPATAGSALVHVTVVGGSHPRDLGVEYPSLLNITDTHDIELRSLQITATEQAEDVVHTTYVRGLQMHGVEVRDGPVDGVDLEFTQGDVRGLRITGVGDDCLDLMGVDLRLSDSILQSCSNNAISAGEQSQLTAHSLYISDSKTGILAKNSSQVHVTGSLITRTRTALRTKRREVHYTGNSRIGVSDLHITECDRLYDAASGSPIDAERIHQSIPSRNTKRHLGRRVLGLADWSQLPSVTTTSVGAGL